MNFEEFSQKIEEKQTSLRNHRLYSEMKTLDDMRQFMQVHVFAVWDFMSLLKRLQNDITGMQIPWMPSPFSKKAVRLINEIVLGEESDECPKEIHPEGYCDHFTMYRYAMKELGVPELLIFEQIKHMNFAVLPANIKEFLHYHLTLASEGELAQVAGSFLFGRERLLPSLFEKVVEQIKAENIQCPSLTYYLERHIEIDGDHHSHMARDLFEEICNTEEKKVLGLEAALKSLDFRQRLWDQALKNILQERVENESRPSLR